MKRLKYFLIGILLAIALPVFAVQISVPSAPTAGYGLTSNSTGVYVATTTSPWHVGSIFATSSTQTSIFKGPVTISGSFALPNQISGCAQFDGSGILTTTSSNCGTGSGSTFPFTPTSWGNATGTTIGFTAGIFSNASSTFTILQSASSTLSGNTVLGNATSTHLGTTRLFINSDLFTDLTGSGLVDSAGALSVSGLSTSNFNSANISQWTNNSSYITLASLSNTAPITYNNVSGAIGCTTASSGVAGCLSNTAFDTFNNKQAAISATWPVILSGATLSFGGLSTTTNLTQGQLPYVTGVNTIGQVATTSVTCTGNASCSAFTAIGAAPITINVAAGTSASSTLLTDFNTWTLGGNTFGNATTTSLFSASTTISKMVFANATGTTLSVSSSTIQFGMTQYASSTALSVSGTASTTNLVVSGVRSALHLAGADGTVSAYSGSANCTNQVVNGISALGAGNCVSVSNAMLSNSTISGVALGGSLFAHTVSGSITGTSYNGSAAVSDWTLNMANANAWTAGQTFVNATSTGGFYAASSTIPKLFTQNASTTYLGLPNITGTQCLHVTNNGVVSGTGADCGAGGSTNAAGSNGQLQFNDGGTAFGAIATGIGSFYNKVLGTLGFGTTTPQWLLQLASSTAPQLVLTDPTAGSQTHWSFRNILGNLFLATSSPTTFATSTNLNPNTGYIEFPNNGGCIGCTDILLPMGINLRSAKYVAATSSPLTANVISDVYTAPTGRRALVLYSAAAPASAAGTFNAKIKSGGSYYNVTTASTTMSATLATFQNVGMVLEPGESVAIISSNAAANIKINLIEYSSDTPFFSARALGATLAATSTLYTVPTGVSAVYVGVAFTDTRDQQTAGVSTDAFTAQTFKFFDVKSGGSPDDNINRATAAAATGNYGSLTGVTPVSALNSGDSVRYYLNTSAATNVAFWLNIYEH